MKLVYIGIIVLCFIFSISCENEITDPIHITIQNKISNKDTLIISGISSYGTDELEYGDSLSDTVQRGTIVTVEGKADPKYIDNHSFTDDNEVWIIK